MGRRNAAAIEQLMTTRKEMGNERRRYPRHANTSESLFITSLNSGKTATVRNINMTGLAMEHFAGEGDRTDWRSIDIFMGGREPLYLPRIRCRLIYDIGELSENITFSGASVRVCGLQFEALSKDQEDKLLRLLGTRATKQVTNSIPAQDGKQSKINGTKC